MSEHCLNQSILDQDDQGWGWGGGGGRFDSGPLLRRRADEKSYFRRRAPLSTLDFSQSGIVIMDFNATEQI